MLPLKLLLLAIEIIIPLVHFGTGGFKFTKGKHDLAVRLQHRSFDSDAGFGRVFEGAPPKPKKTVFPSRWMNAAPNRGD